MGKTFVSIIWIVVVLISGLWAGARTEAGDPRSIEELKLLTLEELRGEAVVSCAMAVYHLGEWRKYREESAAAKEEFITERDRDDLEKILKRQPGEPHSAARPRTNWNALAGWSLDKAVLHQNYIERISLVAREKNKGKPLPWVLPLTRASFKTDREACHKMRKK